MSLIVNGSPTKPFHMQRGLCQGDKYPLSPFLFVLVAEILNMLLTRDLELGVIEGSRLAGRMSLYLISNLQTTQYFSARKIGMCSSITNVYWTASV